MYIPPIFCDLDNIFADFNSEIQRIFHRKPDLIPSNLLWPRLSSIPDFFTYLPWMRDGERLWDAIWPLQPTILTSITGCWAETQKVDWITRELGPEVSYITCLSKHKHYYCPTDRPGAILIDDKDTLRKPWQKAGGIFILHRDTEDTIQKLESLLGIPLETTINNNRC
jgi:hypothetical protein